MSDKVRCHICLEVTWPRHRCSARHGAITGPRQLSKLEAEKLAAGDISVLAPRPSSAALRPVGRLARVPQGPAPAVGLGVDREPSLTKSQPATVAAIGRLARVAPGTAKPAAMPEEAIMRELATIRAEIEALRVAIVKLTELRSG
jgi:hypothetical protein